MDISNYLITNREPLLFKDLDLKQTDIYTQETFEELQSQRFEAGAHCFICSVEDSTGSYLFDASQFIENCVREHEVIENPLNRQPVQDLKVLVSSHDCPVFKLFMTREEVTTPPNHLPIFWNDTSRSLEKRFHYMLTYGKHFETSDIEKTLQVYQEVAELGSIEAMKRLIEKYKSLGQKDEALEWLERLMGHKDIATKDLFYCAHNFEDFEEDQMALKTFKCAAERKNMIGLGEVIQRLEAKDGEEAAVEVAVWRQKLPEAWRDKPIEAFCDHLAAIGYNYSSEGYP